MLSPKRWCNSTVLTKFLASLAFSLALTPTLALAQANNSTSTSSLRYYGGWKGAPATMPEQLSKTSNPPQTVQRALYQSGSLSDSLPPFPQGLPSANDAAGLSDLPALPSQPYLPKDGYEDPGYENAGNYDQAQLHDNRPTAAAPNSLSDYDDLAADGYPAAITNSGNPLPSRADFNQFDPSERASSPVSSVAYDQQVLPPAMPGYPSSLPAQPSAYQQPPSNGQPSAPSATRPISGNAVLQPNGSQAGGLRPQQGYPQQGYPQPGQTQQGQTQQGPAIATGLPYVTPAPRTGRYPTMPYAPVWMGNINQVRTIPAQTVAATLPNQAANGQQPVPGMAPANPTFANQAIANSNQAGINQAANQALAAQNVLPQYRPVGIYPTSYQQTAYQQCAPTFPGAGDVPGTYVPPTYTPNLTPGLYTPNNAGYSPLFSLGQENYNVLLGRGIVGQPTVYVPGQPIRNFMRYIFP